MLMSLLLVDDTFSALLGEGIRLPRPTSPIRSKLCQLLGYRLSDFKLALMTSGNHIQDQAHLPNERMSIANLHRGKAAIERFLTRVVDKSLMTEQTQ
jgi:hypothetical protein